MVSYTFCANVSFVKLSTVQYTKRWFCAILNPKTGHVKSLQWSWNLLSLKQGAAIWPRIGVNSWLEYCAPHVWCLNHLKPPLSLCDSTKHGPQMGWCLQGPGRWQYFLHIFMTWYLVISTRVIYKISIYLSMDVHPWLLSKKRLPVLLMKS